MRLLAYCMPWHMRGSSAFMQVLAEPLAQDTEVDWRTDIPAEPGPREMEQPVVFCQVLPPPAWSRHLRLTWIPMWDQEINAPPQRWRNLPVAWRIVAFSEPIARLAHRAGNDCLRLRYFPPPFTECAVAKRPQRTLFYWNRAGLASAALLERLCLCLRIERLLYRAEIDPGIDTRLALNLPERVGGAEVVPLPRFERLDQYLQARLQANFFLAPRAVEGIGLTLLEAMATGAVVIAADGSTMNEYVCPGRNGILLRPSRADCKERLAGIDFFRRAGKHVSFLRPVPRRGLDERQDWAALERIDSASLGTQALEDVRAGHQRWIETLPTYRRFLTEWQ